MTQQPVIDEAFELILAQFKKSKLEDEGIKTNNSKDNYCYFCKADVDIILDEGNYVCSKCNTLLSRYIDHGAEWRFYGNDDSKGNDPTRCGLPTSDLLPNSSLGSIIGYANKESYQIRIMRKYHMWNSMTYKERSLYNIFESLTANAINNGISKSIIDEAKMLYKQVSEAKISRGENRSGLIASTIYMACKNNKVPRSTKEIAKIFNLKITTMTKGCKHFQEIMKCTTESTVAEDFINRFCSKLGIDNEKRNMAKNVVHVAEDLAIVSENTPPSVAAGAIYLCAIEQKWNVSKKDLAEACDISQVTISKCYKKLAQYKESIFEQIDNI